MKSTFEIGGIQVRSGSRSKGFLRVGPYFPYSRATLREYIDIPFTVVNGVDDGSVFCVTGGLHGTEYTGIAAAIRLSSDVKPDDLKGTLVIVPVVDIPAYQERNYICPIDGVNPQGIFPGSSDGSICYQIIHKVFQELIKRADYYVDLHGGDIHESEICYSHFYRTGDDTIDEKSEGIARALGFKYIVPHAPGSINGYSYSVACEHGISAALSECGSGDKLLLDEVSNVSEGLLNVMRYLNMIEGKPLKIELPEIIERERIRVEHEGLLHYHVKVGDLLSEGDIIGEIKDLYGEVVETVRAPKKGIVSFMIHNPMVQRGESIIFYILR